MPLVSTSTYRASWPFTNAHINTIFPALFRRSADLPYRRETLNTPDGDFLDLDWLESKNKRLIIGLHGLEGDTQRHYLKGIFRYFHTRDWDTLGVNFRSCSGRYNDQLRMYNMGESHDLSLVVKHALQHSYSTIVLAGFSLGGGVVLKFLGESGPYLPKEIKAGVAFSVPIDLPSANVAMARRQNAIYLRRFMRTLNEKLVYKSQQFPGHLLLNGQMPKNFAGFDGGYTGPIHGYAGAEDYWYSCSSLHFLPNITRPTLIINAADDSFLGPSCYPTSLAEQHPHVYLEVPRYGGHCGFYSPEKDGSYWNERRAYTFVAEQLKL
ncbi:MAG: alpha/beta fold hydrolase [Bacteroidota bacterium]